MSQEEANQRDGGDTDELPGSSQRRGLHHPKPDTPESKVEHQADQPGVTTRGKSWPAGH